MEVLDVGTTSIAHFLLLGVDLTQLNFVGTAETADGVSALTAMGSLLCVIEGELLKMNTTQVAVVVLCPFDLLFVPLFRQESDVEEVTYHTFL